ncbi:phospholipase D, Pi-sPLD-like-7 [Phytophthora cinnamomi]|uniref:phospholipase D, Pi-sPLD-like-7 n=1 Tax=Phytophthora cinnamomi TaxID=4785 RepID=UPI0035598595|nr:phospholipase D, Pi-sPLD-like-7 [Phytophthora cinnamomi]
MLVPLKPDVDVTGATSGYHKIFADVVERGGEVSILAWANLLRRGHNIEARDDINNLPASPVNGARATFISDRVRSISSSHHQKTLVIAANSSSAKDDHPVACKCKHYTEFAPYGETSILHARIKAIKNAKNYIYIEDQYFILVPELLDALMEVIPRLQKVMVVAHAPVGQIKLTGYEKYFYEVVSPLQNKFPDKFRVYTTKLERDIYIHSKFVIIDDVYLSVGSANWNRRSMTSDSELNANVVDDETVESPDKITVNKLAREFLIHNSSLIQTLEAEYHLRYVGFTNLIRQHADPQDTCS